MGSTPRSKAQSICGGFCRPTPYKPSVAEPELQRSGANQIDVSLPGVDERRARRAPGRHHGPDVLLRLGAERPRRGLQDQPRAGQRRPAGDQRALQRGQAGVEVHRRDRRRQHGRRASSTRSTRSRTQPLNEGVPEEKRAGPASRTSPTRASRSNAEILEVPEGIIVVRNDDDRAARPARGKVDHGGSSRTTRCSTARTSRTRSRTSRTAAAARRSSRWSSATRAARRSPTTTRAIAQRGADNAALNGGLQNPIGASHHFAIRLDNELISTPYINFRENPDGIDGSHGAADLRRLHDHRRAQDLARLLKIGALPLRLELISRSQVSATLGQQALHQGLIAGLAGFAIVAIFLLVFYRVLGVIAVARALHLRALPVRADQADPDHADAAGHRRPDPHDRRRGGREHRHLRTRQRGDPRTADRSPPASRRATRRASRRSSTRTSSRCSSPSSSSSSPRRGSRASPSCSASARSSRSSRPCSRPRRSCSRCATRALLRQPSALGAGKPRKPITFDFMGASKWFFSAVRRDPAHLRASPSAPTA